MTIYEIPFQTGSNNNTNIVWYLEHANVRDEEHPYTNVLPVINDAIANYGTVTFTFHTAAQPIAWVANGNFDGEKYGATKTSWSNPCYGYSSALAAANGASGEVTPIYAEEWYGDKSYTSFTQHLYNGTGGAYGADSYYGNWSGFAGGEEYYGGLWGDNNLFGGALVINENLKTA